MNHQEIVAALETLKDKVNDADKSTLTRIQDSVKSMEQAQQQKPQEQKPQEAPQHDGQEAASDGAADTQAHTKHRGRPKKVK